MKRTLVVLWYYLSWQRLMIYISAAGITLVAAGLLLTSGDMAFVLAGIGTFIAVGFSLLFGGVAFRLLIANRRLAMVPNFRAHAAIGLGVLALLGSLVIFALLVNLPDRGELPPELRSFPVLFALVSAYLLLSQWLVTYSLGLFGFALLPLALIRLLAWLDPAAAGLPGKPWLMLAIALGAWACLYFAMRVSGRNMRGVASPAWGGTMSTVNIARPMQPPAVGRPRSAAGTLMRGSNDGWPARLGTLFRLMIAMPVIVIALFLIIGMPFGAAQVPNVALMVSAYGIALSMFFTPAEWPARMRCIWLKAGGNRKTFWLQLERSLLGDTLIIGTTTALFAFVARLFAGVAWDLLAIYFIACIVMTLLSAYCGCWFRIAGWRSLPQMTYVVAITILAFAALFMAQVSPDRTPLVALFAILLILALCVRFLARRGFHRIDWCAIRPARSAIRR